MPSAAIEERPVSLCIVHQFPANLPTIAWTCSGVGGLAAAGRRWAAQGEPTTEVNLQPAESKPPRGRCPDPCLRRRGRSVVRVDSCGRLCARLCARQTIRFYLR